MSGVEEVYESYSAQPGSDDFEEQVEALLLAVATRGVLITMAHGHVGQEAIRRIRRQTELQKATWVGVSEDEFLGNTVDTVKPWIIYHHRSTEDMVREFNTTFGHPVRDTPQIIDSKESSEVLQWAFFGSANDQSELEELCQAIANNDIVEIADALGDITWLMYVLAQRHGIDLDAVLREIHKSNMSKLGEDGKPVFYPGTNKIGKGPNYRKPDICKALGLHQDTIDEDDEMWEEA